MLNSIKLRAKAQKGVVTVKALINHPMETGLRKDSKTGKAIPAHYIQQLTAKSGSKSVLDAVWGGAVSTNPYLSFSYNGAQGDSLTLSWADNQGNSDTLTISVS
ncbi:MAG: thiosulfate oxidation carrier complex protein SoxZ [Gammaproteobacteria bacterium]|nr:thiosulfate oxidation carrier complex protein SoxZ [Gammaproteobacteria bacterium]